jgi:hypothetical protein
MKRVITCGVAIFWLATAQAQTPTPVIVPAATQPPTAPAAVAEKPDSELSNNLKALQEIKAANDELLRKQQATLELLDQIQKEADQIRILSKRS